MESDPPTCARSLVGAQLVWDACRGVIVETEAYTDGAEDEACHTFFRPSAREFVRRHRAGAAYIYFNYGMHWLLNVLVKGQRNGFVLIRAVEPTLGLASMRRRRRRADPMSLCSGPGKLCQAFRITGRHHGINLCAGGARTLLVPSAQPRVETGPRVGISRSVDLPWRFLLAGSRFVSSPPGTRRQRDLLARTATAGTTPYPT
jgi:DNA-3-methyladenine glycosylase